MPETSENRTGTIVSGVFLVVLGDALFAALLFVLNVVISGFVKDYFFVFLVAAFNTGLLGWIWVLPVVLKLRHQRPLLARVMIFASAVLSLLNATCYGLMFFGSHLTR